MTKPTLAHGAETAGFAVFTLGAAGILLGMGMGAVTGPEAAGRAAIHTWITYSLSVAVAGALIGSVAGFLRQRRGSVAAPAQTRHLVDVTAAEQPLRITRPAGRARPAVSAFRTTTSRR